MHFESAVLVIRLVTVDECDKCETNLQFVFVSAVALLALPLQSEISSATRNQVFKNIRFTLDLGRHF